MQSITFECEVITPMFLAGADGSTPELRPPSIKGALRFWWRALNGHLPLHELKEKEDEIFGGTDGRSKFSLKVVPVKEIISNNTFKNLNRREYDLIYMAYGAVDRRYYDVGTKFNLIVSSKYESVFKEIKKAFEVLVHLGGLGAKCRNGFGSFSCSSVDDIEVLKKDEVFHKEVNAPYTTFSDMTQIYFSENGFNNWKAAIRELKSLYSDSKKSLFPKKNRVYVGAPWKNIKEPERHAKVHIMSLFKEDNMYYYRITYLPYDYMNSYLEMQEYKRKEHFEKWDKTIKEFNKKLEDTEDRNGNYLINFTFNEND